MKELQEINAKLDRILAILEKPKRVSGTPKARHEYDPDFERLWAIYPKRNGSNPKHKAEAAYKVRRSGIHPTTLYEMAAGLTRYAA